jgi:hypothetical protein
LIRNRKKDKKEFKACKSLLETKRMPFKEEWIELEDNKKLLSQLLMKIRIQMSSKCKRTIMYRNFGAHSSKRRWKKK